MKTWGILLLMAAFLVSCSDNGTKKMSKFQAGQVWTYNTRPGEENSRLTILKTEPYGTGTAIHISVEGVSIKNPHVPSGISTQIGHLPFAEEALGKSVIECVATGKDVSASLEGYNTWKEQADKGKAGVFTVTVAEALGVVETAFSKTAPSTQAATTADHPWRTHPDLKGRFHPDFPDDVQVVIHDGGPRVTPHKPELVWVRVTDCTGSLFSGRVLNAPTQLTTVHEDQDIQFLLPSGSKYLVMVTSKYLAERDQWIIHPCDKCGFTELFDAPSDLIRVIFPNQPKGAAMEMFTSFCPMCGGVQVVERKTKP
jgi:hypothetical protein